MNAVTSSLHGDSRSDAHALSSSLVMTRPELAAAIRSLSEDEKLDLLSELWDELDHTGLLPEWHKEELDRRLDDADTGKFVPWAEARARILGSK